MPEDTVVAQTRNLSLDDPARPPRNIHGFPNTLWTTDRRLRGVDERCGPKAGFRHCRRAQSRPPTGSRTA